MKYLGESFGVRLFETDAVPKDEIWIVPASWLKPTLWDRPQLPVRIKGDTVTEKQKDKPPVAEKDPLEGLVVGRVVYYNPHAHQERNCKPGPWAAFVTHLCEQPGVVNLNVQMPVPAPIGTDPVSRFEEVPFSADRAPGTWSWMFEGQNTRYKPDRTA